MRDIVFMLILMLILIAQVTSYSFINQDPFFGTINESSVNFTRGSAINESVFSDSQSTATTPTSALSNFNLFLTIGTLNMPDDTPVIVQTWVSAFNWLIYVMLLLLIYRQIRSGSG